MTSPSSRKTAPAEPPLLRRFPALAALPRVDLGAFPTPVQRAVLHGRPTLQVKRDDLAGGNKVRALEWLLGAVRPGDRVITVGARGSTHALTTALCAKRLDAQVTVVRWNQVMNPTAEAVEARLRRESRVVDARIVPVAYAIAAALRLRRGNVWIPGGGATPVGVLGHANAALELAEQIERGECDLPERIVVPLGTGGTAAGLALGLRLAGLGTHLVAVRVVPGIVGRIGRVLSLAHRAAALIERVTLQRLPRVNRSDVAIEHRYYGGAYGRALPPVPDEDALEQLGVRLDDSYSRKAFAAAAAQRDHRTLFWLTFDARLIS